MSLRGGLLLAEKSALELPSENPKGFHKYKPTQRPAPQPMLTPTEIAKRAVQDILGGFCPPGSFRAFNVALRIRDRIAGGIPRNPDMVRTWLEQRFEREASENIVEETLEAVDQVEEKVWSGFKRDAIGLYLEERNVKAMIKEAA
ncbi:MAG: hypothetical protein QXI12_00355 [Candidatus Methanomethyliaceae archaeon]